MALECGRGHRLLCQLLLALIVMAIPATWIAPTMLAQPVSAERIFLQFAQQQQLEHEQEAKVDEGQSEGQGKFLLSGDAYFLQEQKKRLVDINANPYQEACLICNLWLQITLLEMPDAFSYMTLSQALTSTCFSASVFNFTYEYVRERRFMFAGRVLTRHKRPRNFQPDCLLLVDTVGELAADMIWGNWDKWYMGGEMSQRVCTAVGACRLAAKTSRPIDKDTRVVY
eukprot:TRINITY_DN61734_c0_g1_i2.p1 TRINITY_DN61734_c0_g1~~TRINITY_DN61734_c0_g1_i2.p1  ORF type:complete len:227 (+),score=78.38 TRINITY_DN61734_c0_g1_i2:68-748(+)